MDRETVAGFTIDAPHSQDLDDALWIEPAGTGAVLFVSIADVAEVIPVGSADDQHAREAVFTRYRGTRRTRPMLSGEGRFSLLPEAGPQPVITFCVTLAANGEPLDDFLPRLCTLDHQGRLSYAEVDAVLNGEKPSPHRERLQQLDALAQAMLKRRRDRGALALYDAERGWATDEEGRVVPLGKLAHRSNVIVQECMILANRLVAEWLSANDQAAVYRNHALREGTVGFDRDAILRELDEIFGGASVEAIMALRARILQALQPAEYGPEATGHYGLNAPAHTHVTSPIRRYADLVNQRIVRGLLQEGVSPYTREQVTELAVRINQAVALSKATTANRYKAAVDRTARKDLIGGRLQALSPDSFLRVITMASRDNWFSEPFAEAVVARLDAGQLQERDFYPLLFEVDRRELADLHLPVHGRLLEAVFGWFLARPSAAVSVLQMAQAKNAIGEVRHDVRARGVANATEFVATAHVSMEDREIKSKVFLSSSKKAAQQGAALILLARILGLDDPEAASIPGALSSGKPGPSVGEAADGNPIAVLGEFAAGNGHTLPTYEFRGVAGRAAHTPTFICTCGFLGKSATGEGASKKAAKRVAAQAMATLVFG